MRQAWKLAREKIQKSKTTHVETHARNPVTIVGAMKSTGHRNTGTGPEEVKEEPMATARA
jgi:hypothetical protein